VCLALRDERAARQLMAWVSPALGTHLVGYEGAGCFGSAARYVGLLAWTLGRRDEAEQALRHAVSENESAGAALFAAHARCDLARLLLGRRARGAREEALALLGQAETWSASRTLAALAADLRAARGEAAGVIPLHDRHPA
jgi:hypothetical protein